MKKVIFKYTQEAFDKGVAAGLGWAADVYAEGEKEPFASVYAGDMSSPSWVAFSEDGIVLERALGYFEDLEIKEEWLQKKEELLRREIHEEEFELLDIDTGIKYYADDPEVYGGEIVYDIVENVKALAKTNDNTYRLFTYKKIKNTTNKCEFVKSLLEKEGYYIESEMDSYYNHDYYVCKDGYKGPIVSYETYNADAIRFEVLTSLGEKIWKEKKITPEIREEIEAAIAEEKKAAAAAAAERKKYAAQVFEDAKIVGVKWKDKIPSIRALKVLVSLWRIGVYLPKKYKNKLQKAYAWKYLRDTMPSYVLRKIEEISDLTFDETCWVLENLPDSLQ